MRKRSPSPRKKRSSFGFGRGDSPDSLKGGGATNRWSQSTPLSSSSAEGHRKHNSFSKRINFGVPQFSSGPRSSSASPRRQDDAFDRSPSRTAKSLGPPPELPAIELPPFTLSPFTAGDRVEQSPLTAETATPSFAQSFAPSANTHYPLEELDPSPPKSQSFERPGIARSRSDTSQVDESGGTSRYEQEQRPRYLRAGDSGTSGTSYSDMLSSRLSRSTYASTRGSISGDRDGSASSTRQPLDSLPPEMSKREKKAQLSKALQKANTAVVLDNAQNHESAARAYGDACDLLQQLLEKTSGDADKRKLEVVWSTYRTRIKELEHITKKQRPSEGRLLPTRPLDDNSSGPSMQSLSNSKKANTEVVHPVTTIRTDDEISKYGSSDTLTERRMVGSRPNDDQLSVQVMERHHPLRSSLRHPDQAQSYPNKSQDSTEQQSHLQATSEDILSPMSPSKSLDILEDPKISAKPDDEESHTILRSDGSGHRPQPSNESVSWLNTIDESGDSSDSFSATSLSNDGYHEGVQRKHLRMASRGTEAEFEAAMDAAVEAAHGDNLEPDADEDALVSQQKIAAAMKNVALAKEKVREAEREVAIAKARGRTSRLTRERSRLGGSDPRASPTISDAAAEEERIVSTIAQDQGDPGVGLARTKWDKSQPRLK